MFDATLQVGQAEVVPFEDHIVVAYHTVLMLPVSPTQAIPVKSGVVRVPMSKEGALTHAQEIMDKANELADAKPQSDLVIANSMQGVDQAAEQAKKFRG